MEDVFGGSERPFADVQESLGEVAVHSTATNVQIQAKLSRESYKGESMLDYVDYFEETFNHQSVTGRKVVEDLQVAMILAFVR